MAKDKQEKEIVAKAIERVRGRFPFEDYMNPSKDEVYHDIAQIILRYLKPNSRILDFGSGPCDKTTVLQTLGFECSAYDDLSDDWHGRVNNREKILKFAEEFGVDFRIAEGGEYPFQNNYFDLLMMNDVLEHLHDSPRELLNDLLQFVGPRGYFLATVPNAVNIRKRISVLFGKTNLPKFEYYYWYPGTWRGHIREYTKDDLIKLSQYLKLEAVELRGCHHMLRKLPVRVRPLYLVVTRIFPGFRDSWLLLARKSENWAPKKTLPRRQIEEILGKSTAYRY